MTTAMRTFPPTKGRHLSQTPWGPKFKDQIFKGFASHWQEETLKETPPTLTKSHLHHSRHHLLGLFKLADQLVHVLNLSA